MTVDMTIHKSIEVQTPVERAWSTFTSGTGHWWPLETHSIAHRRAVDAIIEPRTGGTFYEVQDDGNTQVWADVVVWEPPSRLVLNWRVNAVAEETEIEVTFTAVEGGTRVELEHRGWEDPERQGDYERGWDVVLGRYAKALG